MYTAIIIILLVVIIIFKIVDMMRFSSFESESRRHWSTISDAVLQITDTKRLMEVIKIEGKEDLGIDLKDFEPKKEEILQRMLDILKDEKMLEQYKKNADTFAFCIFQHSGFADFLKYPSDVRKPLTRVLANRDYEAAKRLIKKMVKAL